MIIHGDDDVRHSDQLIVDDAFQCDAISCWFQTNQRWLFQFQSGRSMNQIWSRYLRFLVIDWLWCNAIAVPEWIRFGKEIARMFASSFMVFYSPFLFVSMDEWKEEGGEGEGRTWFVPSGGGHFGIHQVTTDRSDRNLSLPDRQLMNVSPILSLFISDFSYAVPFGALLSCHRDLEESLRILGESCTSQSWNLSICDNGWDDPEAHMDFFSLSLSLSLLFSSSFSFLPASSSTSGCFRCAVPNSSGLSDTAPAGIGHGSGLLFMAFLKLEADRVWFVQY